MKKFLKWIKAIGIFIGTIVLAIGVCMFLNLLYTINPKILAGLPIAVACIFLVIMIKKILDCGE